MRCSKFIFGIFSFLLLFLNTTCKDVDSLNNDAEVVSFQIISHSPDGVSIGEPEIVKDTIFIPLLFGKYYFPLTVEAEVSFSPSKDKVIGEFNHFVFQYNQNGDLTVNGDLNAATFYVVSQSGFTKRWHVTLKESSDSDNASIRSFVLKKNKTGNAFFCPKGLIDNIDTTVSIYYIHDVQFPQKITPEILLSDGAKFSNDYDDTLRFSSESRSIDLKVISSSGKEKVWNIRTKKATEVSNIAVLSPAEKIRLSLSKTEFELSGNNAIPIDIEDETGTIVAYLNNPEFPVVLKMKYGNMINKQVVGVLPEEELTFSSENDLTYFYVFDDITGRFRKWKIQLQEMVGGATDIYGITIGKVTSGILQMEPDVRIDKLNSTVFVDLPTSANTFPLHVEVKEWTLPVSAQISGLENSITFTTNAKAFTVTNGTISQEWKMQLSFTRLNDDADVQSFTIKRSSGGNKLFEESARIDPVKGIIRILLEEASFPFTIEPEVRFSTGAFSENVVSGQLLEFSSWEDIISFQVKAESGLLKQWEIRLMEAPQLKNADFREWGSDDNPLYWATANNSVITGTTPANSGGVLLTTKKNTDLVKAIAAASVFLGKFTFKLSDFDQPKMMTNFGIPFTAKPIAIEVDLNYTAGAVLEKLDKGKNDFVAIPNDKDRGVVWVELLYWDGKGEYEYHGKGIESSVVCLAHGEKEFDNTNGWQYKVRIPIEYANQNLKPTHITIVMSSGSRGDDFIGATGSKLLARNVKLIY